MLVALNIWKHFFKKNFSRNVNILPKYNIMDIYQEDVGYDKNTIDYCGNGRSLSYYEAELLFKAQDLENKTVLNLGAGAGLRFENDLFNLGLNVDVYSLSPDFFDSIRMDKAVNSCPKAKIFAGVGQNMPFEDDMFDYIFSLHLIEHLTYNRLIGVLLEVSRTLKSGGVFKIGPVHDEFDLKYFMMIDENLWLKEKLSDRGVTLNQKILPKETHQYIIIKDQNGMSKELVPCYQIVLKKQ